MKRDLRNMDVRDYVSREDQRKRLWRSFKIAVGIVTVFYGIILISSYLVSRT